MYKDLKYYLAKVSFPDVDNFPFRFKNETRDGPARYSIITYYRNKLLNQNILQSYSK